MLIPSIIVSAFFVFYLLAIKPFRKWSRRGIKQFSLPKIWLDNCKIILQLNSSSEILKKTYSAFSQERYAGSYQFNNPLFLVRDPDLIKRIAVKDFDYFMDHNQFISGVDSLWEKNLFALKGEEWKDMRSTLSPSFTSNKMKIMFDLISECAENFVQYFKSSKTTTVELKDAFTRYTNDVIGSVGFGVTCNSLRERDNEFYLMGREATNTSGFWRNISFLVIMLIPRFAKLIGLSVFSKKVSAFFRKLVKETMELREKNGIVRPDMIHLLLEAKNDRLKHAQSNKRQLSDEDLTAQALIFFFAGFESVSTLMCFAAYELAVNPGIQEKLQQEIDNTLNAFENRITYESVQKMEYLDMVLSETLRKWPSVIATDRVCLKPYTIEPTREEESSVHLQIGDVLWIPIIAIHYDETIYPEPDKFIPERFSQENKEQISPYKYFPFGVGPRSCIGSRFALLETKILFVNILKNFDIVVVKESVVPLKVSRKQFNLASETGFWFGLSPRQVTA